MIITCAECTTQFQLDEARVPESGIRVRCSVCKHAFFVAHPDTIEGVADDPVSRVVNDVLAAEPGGVPEAAQDLDARDAASRPGERPDDGGDERWEFDDGGRLSEAAGRDPSDRFEVSFEAAREAVDDLLGGPWKPPEPAPTFSRPVDDATPREEPEPPVGIAAPLEGDESSGLALADDPWESPDWSGPGEAASPAEPETVAPPFSQAAFPEERPAPDPEAAPPDAKASFDRELPEADALAAFDEEPADAGELEIGSFADAPFEKGSLGEALEAFETADDGELDPFEAELSSPDEASDFASPEGWGLEAPPERAPLEVAGLPTPARAEATVTAPIPLGFDAPFAGERERGIVLAWLARAGNGIGWSAVAILAAATLWGSVAPRAVSARGSGSQPLAGLEATGVAGRWVENATLGPLYVVSGELHNPGSKTKAPGARLVVRLLDAQGHPVDESAASLGPPLGTLALREARRDDLRELGEAAARTLARTPVAPGARIPFEAVVLDLPDAAQRFDLAARSR